MATRKEREAAWEQDQLDADNWVRIPDFGIQPAVVDFAGFAFPIVHPSSRLYEGRLEIRRMVKTAREIARAHFASLAEMHEVNLAGLDAWETDADVTDRMFLAMFYWFFMQGIETALLASSSRGDQVRALASAANTLSDMVELHATCRETSAEEATAALLQRLRRPR